MIEINLIPDVKNELLKAQRLRNSIISICILVSIASAALILLISSIVYAGQPLMMGAKDREIEERFAELENYPDIQSVVTLQNQLSQIESLRTASPETSRLLGQVIIAIQPTGENSVSYSSISYSPEDGTVSIEGESNGGFPALEAFRKTIAETLIVYRDETGEQGCTVEDVVNQTNDCISEPLVEGEVNTNEQSLSEGDDGGRVMRFSVSFVLNPRALSFASKDFAVLPPGRKDVTDSRIQIPDDIFRARTGSEGDE